VDTYEGDLIITRTGSSSFKSAIAAANNTAKYSYTIIATADVKLTANTTLNAGVTLSLGSHALELGNYLLVLSGGTVRASKSLTALKNSGMISETVIGGEYIYTAHTVDMAFTGMSLVLGDNISMRMIAKVDGISNMKDPKVYMIVTDSTGVSYEHSAESSKNGEYVFTSNGIPPRKMGEPLVFQICVRSNSLGNAGEIRSAGFVCSPVDYVKSSYGVGELFDDLLASMLNYGSEAQTYFNYNASSPVNAILPADKRNISEDPSLLIRANAAPVVEYNSTAHITSAQLVLLDNVALRLHSSGDSGNAKLTLLVWSEADYLALQKNADKSGKPISDYLVKGNETYSLADEEGSFTLEDIPVKKFADTYYFRLCQTEGGKSLYDYVFSYSVTSYCADKVGDGVTEDIDSLCLAIAEYSACAREYFGYKINGK
jgi:hypothetical protein